MEPWNARVQAPDPWDPKGPSPQKSPHRWIPVAIILAVFLVLAAVTAAVLLISLSGDHDALYDDLEALSTQSSYSAFKFINSRTGDNFSGSVGKLSGVYAVSTCTVKQEAQVEVHYTLEVTNGKAKLVLVTPDGAVTVLQECLAGQSAERTVTLTLPEGTSRFKLAGAEDAALSWKVELE